MSLPRFVRYFWRWNQYERDVWIEKTVKERVAPGDRVLDVGAGSCPFASLFEKCDYKTHDFKQLQPHQLYGRKGYGAIDYVSDISAIPAADASFDVILCTEVIEHVPEPLLAVKEMGRLAADGGLLILTAPLGSGLHQVPFHYYGGYTPWWYERALGDAGFENIKVVPSRRFFSFYSQEGLRFLQRLAPWRSLRNLWAFPVWLAVLPFCGILLPLCAPLLDRLDDVQDFTIGYFVTARRRQRAESIASLA
jgi:ubiquinone/menaquinone biosynthesis C-methylase UbiE